MVYGQVPINDGEVQMALNPSHELGEVITWPDGRKWILVHRYKDQPLAGGRYVDPRYAVWFLAVEAQ